MLNQKIQKFKKKKKNWETKIGFFLFSMFEV